MQPFQVLLQNSATLQHVNNPTQLGVIWKYVDHLVIEGNQLGQLRSGFPKSMMSGPDPLVVL